MRLKINNKLILVIAGLIVLPLLATGATVGWVRIGTTTIRPQYSTDNVLINATVASTTSNLEVHGTSTLYDYATIATSTILANLTVAKTTDISTAVRATSVQNDATKNIYGVYSTTAMYDANTQTRDEVAGYFSANGSSAYASYGLYAISNATNTAGFSYGGYTSGTDYGLYAQSTATGVYGNGTEYGVVGESNTATGATISGVQYNASGYGLSITGGKNYLEGNLGIGTTTTSGKLGVVGETLSSYFTSYATTSTSTMLGNFVLGNNDFTYQRSTGTTTVNNLETGLLSFIDNSGQSTWLDMGVTSGASNNTIESYIAKLDGNNMISVYGLADGAGNMKNLGVAIGTSTPTAMLTIWVATTTTATPIALDVKNVTGQTLFGVMTNGHEFSSSTAPVLSSCGTSPTINGTDADGTVTAGTGATACTVTFNAPYVASPHCTLSQQTMSLVNSFSYTLSSTTIVVTQTGLGGNKFDYICKGQ
jgi:hypothetical protein